MQTYKDVVATYKEKNPKKDGTWKYDLELGFHRQGGRVGYKPGGLVEPGVTHYGKGFPMKVTEERLAVLDNYIKNTDLSLKEIGEKPEFGYKKTKPGKSGQLRSSSPLMKEYEKIYGKIPEERFKPYKFTKDSSKVKRVIDLFENGMSKKAIAFKTGISRKEIRTIFHQFKPQWIGDENMPSGEGKNAVKKRRLKLIKEYTDYWKEKPGGKEMLEKMNQKLRSIKLKNAEILKMSDEAILNNKLFKEAMNLDVKGLKIGEGINFNRYANLTDAEYIAKVKGMATTNQFYQPEHLIPINKKNPASMNPKNIYTAVGKLGGQMETMKNYVINNPNSKYTSQINELFTSQGMPTSENIIKSNKIISKTVPEPLLISGAQTLTPDGYQFTGIDYDKPSRWAELLKQGVDKTPKPVGSVLRGAGKLATGVGRFIFDPFLFPSIPVEMMISGAAGFEKNKKELKKALKDAPIVSQMAKEYNMTAEEVRNAIFEKYREAALANETGLEEQMAFVPAHQKDVEKFDKNFFPFWDTESYEGKPHADTSYVKKEPFKQMVGDSFLAARAEDEEAERKLRTGEIAGTQFYKKPTYYTKKDYYPDDFSDKTLAGQLRSAKQIRFENLRGLEDPLPAGFFKGGRVSFSKGSFTRRGFLKLLAALGIGTAGAKSGISLFGKAVGKKAVSTAGVDIVSSTPGMPSWFPALVNKIIKEGDDVTSKLATQERQVVHTKKLGDPNDVYGDEVTVYRDLDTGDIRVESYSGSNMGEAPIQMEYKAPSVIDEGKMKGKKTDSEFSAVETEPRVTNWDGDIEFDGDNIVGNVDDLMSDTTKVKNYAEGKKPTLKDIVTSKKKRDAVKNFHDDQVAQMDYIENKQGHLAPEDLLDAEDAAYHKSKEGLASGGRVNYDTSLPDIDDID